MKQKIYTMGQFAKYHHVCLREIKNWRDTILKQVNIPGGRSFGIIFIKGEERRHRYGFPEKLVMLYPAIPDSLTIHKIIQEADPTYRPDIDYANM